jgi:hypothetical protein
MPQPHHVLICHSGLVFELPLKLCEACSGKKLCVALQEALRLKESKAVDEVVAVSLGPQQVQVRCKASTVGRARGVGGGGGGGVCGGHPEDQGGLHAAAAAAAAFS